MKYSVETNTVDCSVEELCLLTVGFGNYVKSDEDKAYICELEGEIDGYIKFLDVSKSVKLATRNIKLHGVVDGYCDGDGKSKLYIVKALSQREYNAKKFDGYFSYIKICGYLFCLVNELDFIDVGIMLKNTADGQCKTVEKRFSKAELEIFVIGLLSKISGRINYVVNHETAVRPSASCVPFPYGEIREGQEEMMRCVSSVIKKGKRMFAQAPTGIGKTISALYPAVRSFGRGDIDKIFYLTAKTSTAREAYSAAARLSSAGSKLKTIVLSSKDYMCCSAKAKENGCRDGRFCNVRDCKLLSRYSDKAPVAIDELLSMQNGFYASVIKEVAVRHGICPYELSLDLSELCDIIICDYNYLFDPFVHLIRYFDRRGDFGEYVFLVDEAHNLVDRARDMYSASVSSWAVSKLCDEVEIFAPELKKRFCEFAAVFERAKELCRDNVQRDTDGLETGYYISRSTPEFIGEFVISVSQKLDKWLKANKTSGLYKEINDLYSAVRRFALLLEYYDGKYMTYVEVYGGETKISLNCIDPSDIIDDILSTGRATLMFSATLTPLSYFRDLLGGGKSSLCMELLSPYEQKNLFIAAVDTVSTRFGDRNKSYKKIATLIAAAVSGKAGNYMVYFPSYSYLENVHNEFVKKYPKVTTIVQTKGMTREGHEEFIHAFKDDENKMRIGFCVLGGSFSEGIDLPGNRLIGSIIVGVGLPGFSSERNIMRDYFENRYENGFDYAYTYPGMNNVLQAAGRVIRRDKDRGVVVLIDDRYGTPVYKNLFPKHWNHLKYAGNSSSLAEIVGDFWKNS